MHFNVRFYSRVPVLSLMKILKNKTKKGKKGKTLWAIINFQKDFTVFTIYEYCYFESEKNENALFMSCTRKNKPDASS